MEPVKARVKSFFEAPPAVYDPETLLSMLHRVMSVESSVRQEAEAWMQSRKSERAFHEALVSCAFQAVADHQAVMLSSILLRNFHRQSQVSRPVLELFAECLLAKAPQSGITTPPS